MIHLSDYDNVSALTFEAEELSKHHNRWEAYGMLIYLLEHPCAVVREGAVYGLASFEHMPGLREILLHHSLEESEKSSGVRQAVKDVLTYL